MKVQTRWIVFSVLSMVVAACGQQTPSLTFDPVSYNPVSSGTFNSAAYVRKLAEDNKLDLQTDFYAAVFFPQFGPEIQQTRQNPVLKQQFSRMSFAPLSMKAAVSKQATCSPTASGNLQDADQDLIVVNGKFTSACTTVDDGVSFNINRSYTTRDKNDSDPWGGFAEDYLSEWRAQEGNNQLGLRFAYSMDDTRQTATSHSFVSQNRYDELFRGTSNGQAVNGKLTYTYKQTLTVTKVADGFSLTVNGYTSVFQTVNGQSGGGGSAFSGTLHASNSEVCKGIDSGTITFTSGGFTAQMVYTGCNQAVIQ